MALQVQKTQEVGLEYGHGNKIQEIIKGTTSPVPVEVPLALNFKETEITDPEDMLLEIVRLKAILNAIYDAWTNSKMDGVTELGIKEFLVWIKDKKNAEKFGNPYNVKYQNVLKKENLLRRMKNVAG